MTTKIPKVCINFQDEKLITAKFENFSYMQLEEFVKCKLTNIQFTKKKLLKMQ